MKFTRRTMLPWLQALVALALVTWAMMQVRTQLEKAHVAMLYLLIVLAGSALGGRAVGLMSGGAAFLLFDYFFLPPFSTLAIHNPLDWLVLATFLITSVVAAELLDRQRRQTRLATQRQQELDQLSGLGAETLNAARAEHALAAIAGVIRGSVNVARCELFARSVDNTLLLIADSDNATTRTGDVVAARDDVADSEGLLQYIITSGQAAILHADSTVHVQDNANTTESAPSPSIHAVRAFAMPLTVRGNTVGALRLSDRSLFSLGADQQRVLRALAYYAALGMDRLRLEQTEGAAERLRQMDRLKDALLAAVSHDLRTPLTTIKAIAHEIATDGIERAVVIEEEADRLAKLVDGLLELSELNAGATQAKLELNTVDELVGVAIDRCSAAFASHRIETDLQDWELLVGYFDFASSLRILTNLLENAAKYSPASAPIQLSARRESEWLEISVADRGAGIPESDRARIFEPFYRVPGATADVRGAGLGLSIARRLAVAQGGDLRVEARNGGGSVFTLVLRNTSL
jgi:two-component system sensor histidine kinase KdpD